MLGNEWVKIIVMIFGYRYRIKGKSGECVPSIVNTVCNSGDATPNRVRCADSNFLETTRSIGRSNRFRYGTTGTIAGGVAGEESCGAGLRSNHAARPSLAIAPPLLGRCSRLCNHHPTGGDIERRCSQVSAAGHGHRHVQPHVAEKDRWRLHSGGIDFDRAPVGALSTGANPPHPSIRAASGTAQFVGRQPSAGVNTRATANCAGHRDEDRAASVRISPIDIGG
jgi:hypothetical protein